LRGIVEVEKLPTLSAQSTAPTLDLLQGRFARRLPWQRWAELWRVPAIAAAVAIVVQFMVAGFQHHQLQKENIALRQQVEQIYRTVEPAGAVVDAERQLQRKVKALQGSQGSAVLPLLQRLGGAIKSIDGITIQTLGYSEKQNELRLNIIAGSFKDVESLRAAIVTAGLDAQLVSSSADGDAANPKTRAQLRIAERR
jgi:general secretion pathway protein L